MLPSAGASQRVESQRCAACGFSTKAHGVGIRVRDRDDLGGVGAGRVGWVSPILAKKQAVDKIDTN